MSEPSAPISLRAATVVETAGPATREVAIVGVPRSLSFGSARGGEAAQTVDCAPDDILRVEHDNGLVLWMRADDLLRERGRRKVARGVGSVVWDIDTAAAPDGSAQRGMVGLGIKVLELFGVDLKQQTAAAIGKTFEARQLENRSAGVYAVSLGADGAMSLVPQATQLPTGQPLLVFLHGTGSSTKGSFGNLWAGDGEDGSQAAASARETLRQRYGGTAYALEHRSLTESPIANALALARQLPVGAQLHLVSHSRGGLVGECLCLAERDRGDDPLKAETLAALFAADRTIAEQLGLGPLDAAAAQARDAAYEQDRALLRELLALLDERQVQVARFVRVACPARGTTLASGRLDRWLSVMSLLAGALPHAGPFADLIDFLLAVVKERTDPRTLPGLEAMMPGSALTRLLQHPALVTRADLTAIAGDVQGNGPWDLKIRAADWFFAGDHDLVVNTGSMLGGIRRPAGSARYQRDEGEQVTHFNYFRNRKTIGWLVGGLSRAEGDAAGFLSLAEVTPQEPAWRSAVRASRGAGTARPIAVVIPGTMGSALNARGQPVWLSKWTLMRGGLGEIAWGAPDVQPVDLIDEYYGPLLEHLAQTHRVEIVPYDWRDSIREAARLLAAKLASVLPEAEAGGQPVHIVAHSMGGLVARAMIADAVNGAPLWRRITALKGSRLLMLGTPNFGSHEAMRWLVGANPTEVKLTLLDLTRGVNDIIDVVRRYPGLLELLPFDQQPNPFAQVATWQKLKAELGAGWNAVDDAPLRGAAATWELLRQAAPDPACMVYVAGCQPATVVDYQVVQEEFGAPRRRLEWIATAQGDGTVPWASGRLPGVPVWYAPDTAHDELCSNADDRRVFRAYVELLMTGKTDQLPATPPATARGAPGSGERFVLPPQPVADDIPDDRALRGMGFSGGRGPRRRGAQATLSSVIEVGVRHGDLAYARYPVVVGHYLGDTIVSAEAALDGRLQHALTRRLDLGLYPGPSGSHAVFFNEDPDRSPTGAVVIGLGQVGELSPARLEAGMRDAMLDHALALLLRPAPDDAEPDAPRRAKLSCLLVGTGAGGLPVRDSIEAMLRGALAANRKLSESRLDRRVLIDKIELLEVFEDVAISAARELAVVLQGSELAARVRWPERSVEDGEGRRQRRRFDADMAWWQRLEIVEDGQADRLRFIATADRARAEETLATGQLRLADAFIARACASPASDADVAKTLFEMLLPNRLKQSAPDQRDIVLLLDAASARFPWELLQDRWSHTGRPPAVTGGMVRQLKTTQFRDQPAHALESTVYVVGNPDLGGWNSFPDLPGARREAETVRDLFAARGYQTTASIDEAAPAIVAGLHSAAWRVLHLAGHGEHEFAVGTPAQPGGEVPRLSGMVIGKDTFLTPGDVQQMRYVPELVFINCCHLGKTQGASPTAFNQLAANLGAEFIEMGVKAVVAAGWAVDDAAASTFAEKFYQRLLDGDTFGQAVLAARHAAWTDHPGANTWGAYQCYGDPGYRLHRDGRLPDRSAEPEFFAASEVVTELRNLAEAARMRCREDDDTAVVGWLTQRIDALLARVPAREHDKGDDGWLGRADIAATLGFAYGEGGLFGDAVRWLERALASGRGDCPVRAFEQCANFKVRLAAQEWAALDSAAAGRETRERRAARKAFAQRIDAAIRELELINLRASTAERLALIGGACKRLAWVHGDGKARGEALRKMADCYHQAYAMKREDDAYTFTNWAVGQLLLAEPDAAALTAEVRSALTASCARQTQLTAAARERSPNFWNATGAADIRVVELLLAAADKAAVRRLAEQARAQYADALAGGASPRELASVREHLDFVAALTRRWNATLRDALDGIRRAL